MTLDNNETITLRITLSRHDYEQACKHKPGEFDFSETLKTRLCRVIKNGQIMGVGDNLEAWEKVKAEITEIRDDDKVVKTLKYIFNTIGAKNHDISDDYSDGRYDVACEILRIIDKHLKEVEECTIGNTNTSTKHLVE